MSKAPASVSKSGTRTVAPGAIDHSQELGHGNSPAAWTCVIVMLVGALIASIAFVIASTPIFIAGPRGWRQAAENMRINDALLIDANGKITLTASMAKRLKFADGTPRPQIVP